MTTHQWDAQTYDRIADPQTRWGATVLSRLELRGDERVLDAACGTGRVASSCWSASRAASWWCWMATRP